MGFKVSALPFYILVGDSKCYHWGWVIRTKDPFFEACIKLTFPLQCLGSEFLGQLHEVAVFLSNLLIVSIQILPFLGFQFRLGNKADTQEWRHTENNSLKTRVMTQPTVTRSFASLCLQTLPSVKAAWYWPKEKSLWFFRQLRMQGNVLILHKFSL